MSENNTTILDILNMEELELLENLTGQKYGEIFGSKTGVSAKALYSIHWILEKRNNPDADIAVSRKLKQEQINDALRKHLNDPKE